MASSEARSIFCLLVSSSLSRLFLTTIHTYFLIGSFDSLSLQRIAPWNVFEPRLVGGDLDRLTGSRIASGLDDALPALPREFVVVPDADERPTRARVLQIGIGEVALVDDAIAVDRQRVMEIAGLA